MPTSQAMHRLKSNIRALDRHVALLPESNEKQIIKQIYISLDNVRRALGEFKDAFDYNFTHHNSRLLKLEKRNKLKEELI